MIAIEDWNEAIKQRMSLAPTDSAFLRQDLTRGQRGKDTTFKNSYTLAAVYQFYDWSAAALTGREGAMAPSEERVLMSDKGMTDYIKAVS